VKRQRRFPSTKGETPAAGALSYHHENPQEIQTALKEDREVGAKIERDREGFVRKRSAP
jgi:predicted Zn-dependent protease